MTPTFPPGFDATAYNLMTPSGTIWDCAAGKRPETIKGPCPEVFEANPEWFVCWTLDANGENPTFQFPCKADQIQQPYVSQPCWSNASLVANLVANVLSVLRNNPTTPIIMVDQMDGNVPPWLVCPPDHADNERLNTTGGAMFLAVNAVAKAVESEFPDVVVMTEACE